MCHGAWLTVAPLTTRFLRAFASSTHTHYLPQHRLPSAGQLSQVDRGQWLRVPGLSPSLQKASYWYGEQETGDWGSDHTASSTSTRLTPSHSRKALRNSRIVSQKDDVHVCIMCLRAIMNYQVSWPHGTGAEMVCPPGTCVSC